MSERKYNRFIEAHVAEWRRVPYYYRDLHTDGYFVDSVSSHYILSYHVGVYPYLRAHCESRACISLIAKKLNETIEQLSAQIDVSRKIDIAGSELKLKRTSLVDSDTILLYKFILQDTRLYPAEVNQLPFDTP